MALLKRIYPQEQTLEAVIERPAARKVVGQGIQESTIYPAEVTVKGVKLSLLEKVFDTPNSNPEDILCQHRKLKRKGIPTIPVMFVEEGTRSLYVTDLTQRGKRLCLSTMDWQSDGVRHGTRCGDYRFFRLNNGPKVSSDFAGMVLKATKEGVKFSHQDVFFLVIDENGQGKIICGDLGEVDYADPSSSLFEYNRWAAEVFMNQLNKHLDPLQMDCGIFNARLAGAVL